MGPPLSPRETRRSVRRSVPAASATSKSPDSDIQKDTQSRPPLVSTNSGSRNKRLKQEDQDDPLNGSAPSIASTTSSTSNGRTKRKSKDSEKDKHPPVDEVSGDVPAGAGQDAAQDPQEEEEQGVTRCICGSTGLSNQNTFSRLPIYSSYSFQVTTRWMLVNSWFNAKHAKFGSMVYVWDTTRNSNCTTTTITASFVNQNYTQSSSSAYFSYLTPVFSMSMLTRPQEIQQAESTSVVCEFTPQYRILAFIPLTFSDAYAETTLKAEKYHEQQRCCF